MFLLPVLLELINQLTECRPLLRKQLPALTHCQLIPVCLLANNQGWIEVGKKSTSHFFWTERRILQPLIVLCNVIKDLMILNPWVWRTPKWEHFPASHSKRPLHDICVYRKFNIHCSSSSYTSIMIPNYFSLTTSVFSSLNWSLSVSGAIHFTGTLASLFALK